MIPRDGLVAEYTFDGDVRDTSGRGRHATAQHGVTFVTGRTGIGRGAIAFDGTAWLEVAPAPCAGAGAISVSLWARFDPHAMRGWTDCIVAQDDGNDDDQSRRSFQMSCSDGRVIWHRMIQSRDPTAGRRIVPGAWYHFVGVADGREHRLYVDGILNDTVTGPFASHPSQPLHIGRKGTDEDCFFFRGAVDDLRIYDRALTDEEVRSLFSEHGYVKPALRPGVIRGRWGHDGVVYLDLHHDGGNAVRGRIMAGRPTNMADAAGTFDPATGRFALEGAAAHHQTGAPVTFRLEGTVDGQEAVTVARVTDADGQCVYDGMHILSRRGARRRWWQHSRVRAALMGPALRVYRLWWSRTRPSKARNRRLLEERGESVDAFVIRDATAEDIPALSQLHVTAWNATYNTSRGPTVAIREWQWRRQFAHPDGSWFVLVVENARGELIGFARGIRRPNGTGDFNKLYLLPDYQRLGLGRRLAAQLATRFLDMGITRMSGFVDPGNPSCAFFEYIGGQWGRDDAGRRNYSCFAWEDLSDVVRRCEGSG